MNREAFDILIVGAGPAGSFAAERLARGGVRVALFDGRPEGEPKACGGGVTAKALKAWPHLLGAVGRSVDELEMYSPSGKRLHLQLEEPFAIYSRVAFDSYLRDRARDAGANLFYEKISAQGIATTENNEGWFIRSASGGEWSGRMLLGADGANSVVAKKLAGSLPPAEMEVAFGYRAPLPEKGDAPAVIAFLPGWDGYAWAFPRLDHISFGIATAQLTFNHEWLDSQLWKFMIGYYLMRIGNLTCIWPDKNMNRLGATYEQVATELQKTVEPYASRIPKLTAETWAKRQTQGKGWALLGDAAGFADPITGEGIYYALRSSELFTACFLEGRIDSYEQLWRQDFGNDLKRASEMRARFYGNFLSGRFTERMIQFAGIHPNIRRKMGELVVGDQGYVGLKGKLILSLIRPF